MTFQELLASASDIVWGPPMLVLLVGTGIYLTVLLGGLQFTALWPSLRLALVVREEKGAKGDITHYQALMTALAATVGTGNIAGVATAIAAGGPGALFWMWMTGLVGMATKFAEALLAVKYRVVDDRGEMAGGPMYYLERGLGMKWLGLIFAGLTAVAAFGIGNMVQSNSVAHALNDSFGVPLTVSGLVMAVATALVVIGGIHSIARVSTLIVPVMIVFYLVSGLIVLAINWRSLPDIVLYVFRDAFSPAAATGGFAGATVMQGIRYGVARGVFSNESGLGTGAIAAAAARSRHPVSQALVSMTQTFIDTIVVCSITGFAIIATGAWTSGETGSVLTTRAFSTGLPGTAGGAIVAIALALFAYSTLIGWSYYGEKALEYLFGHSRFVFPYRVVWVAAVFVGAITSLETVWSVADVFNGAMALPNLIALIGLSGVIRAELRTYLSAPAPGMRDTAVELSD
jgi:AGCS family alanine or glycine:cation symporter